MNRLKINSINLDFFIFFCGGWGGVGDFKNTFTGEQTNLPYPPGYVAVLAVLALAPSLLEVVTRVLEFSGRIARSRLSVILT